MSLQKGKHIIKEIEGTRCTLLESGISKERTEFLKKLMEHNGFVVKAELEVKKDETLPDTYVIGVTDISFNPVIAVYQRILRNFKNQIITPQYWNQETEETEESKGWYWKISQQK